MSAVKAVSATITVASSNGLTASCAVTVEAKVIEIEATCTLNDKSEVANIIQDNANCDIYDLNGRLLKKALPPNDIRTLNKGLYIIVQENKHIKIML